MRRLDWLHILQQSRQWILLLCVSSGFFIFLAWVAYPDTFKLLVLTMLIFTFVTIDWEKTIPYIFSDDDEERTYKTHRFSLKCKTSDFKYIPMLKAICNHDIGVRPSIFHRVHFININRKTIFHIYDDRGCDLLATSPETIRDVYDKYNDWILDYDRNEIDEVFK
ncbi:DUF3885 domain-containing protein [Viridibacillus sp. FSL H7-0596]